MSSKDYFNPQFPTVNDLRRLAKTRIPKFAFEYLDGGCNDDVNLEKNTEDIRKIELEPRYIIDREPVDLTTTLFGETYSAPFGVAPVGLQGLIWPGSCQMLAKVANQQHLPFILSTVTTGSIEEVGEITEGKAWFQLYHPADEKLRDDLLQRAWEAGYRVLVILSDVPSFGYRPRDIRNGLSMPPSMSLKNILQITGKPTWAFQTLIKGTPEFKNLLPYMPKGLDLSQLGAFMDQTFSGYLNESRIKKIRDQWKGKLVLKGVASLEDAQLAQKLGLDGIIVSNHGGRQLDGGTSAIKALRSIEEARFSEMTVMMDSGIRSGPDLAATLASGAQFTFLGRAFMYGVGALGEKGGHQVVNMLKRQLTQVMEQVGVNSPDQLKNRLVVEK
ncbi:MAG: alpha-hydroxy acid oxidase [Bacteroidota bacterium]